MKNKVLSIKYIQGIVFIVVNVFFISSITNLAYAHVVVKPAEVGIGERTNFVVSVPTEEENPTVQVRVVIPEGMQNVRPNVKPGWNIELVKAGDEAEITEIIWTGGSIPAEQRDEFIFSAQAPAQEETLVWKAYQTYSNDEIIAWENSPEVVQKYVRENPSAGDEDDHSAPKPYSQTTVINDLSFKNTNQPSQNTSTLARNQMPILLSAVALGISILSYWNTRKIKK